MEFGTDRSVTNSENHTLPNQFTRGTVLIIDDDSIALDIMKELLDLNGFNVFSAGEGETGISLFRDNPVDLVITDIRMPRIDGLEVLAYVKEIDDTATVIVVTGHGDLDSAVRALRRGAYDFLLKPINVEILLNTITQAIDYCRLKRFERDYRLLLEKQVKERTKELAETNEFLRGILDSSTQISIVLTDFNSEVLFWNKGAENIFGYTAEEMLGRTIETLYPSGPDAAKKMNELHDLMKSQSGNVQSFVTQRAKSGKDLTILLSVSAMRDASDRVRGILGLGQDVSEQLRLNDELLESYKRIRTIQGASIFALARLAEIRDGEIGNHLKRMQEYCLALCEGLKQRHEMQSVLTAQYIEDLVQVSVLHDIGKVSIPDAVLFNPHRFGATEFEIMKRHAVQGGKALERAADEVGEDSYLSIARDIAYYHHEKWNGSGYPEGLEGEEIPLCARIVALADVYDALTTERRYKRAFSHEEAKSIIVTDSGKHFDPQIVSAFLESENEFKAIKRRFSNQELEMRLKKAQ